MDIHIFRKIAIITFKKAFICSTAQVWYWPCSVTIWRI